MVHDQRQLSGRAPLLNTADCYTYPHASHAANRPLLTQLFPSSAAASRTASERAGIFGDEAPYSQGTGTSGDALHGLTRRPPRRTSPEARPCLNEEEPPGFPGGERASKKEYASSGSHVPLQETRPAGARVQPSRQTPHEPLPKSPGTSSQSPDMTQTPCGASVEPIDVTQDDGVLFRQRVRETERRFREQMAVHRGLSAALRDVSLVQSEVQVLRSEEKLTQRLALLRGRQEEMFARAAVAATAVPLVQPPLTASSTTIATAAANPSSSPGGGKAPEAASPLHDILKTFSKPRGTARRTSIPSPPPIGDGDGLSSRASQGKGSSGGRVRQHRCDVVHLDLRPPQPYPRIHWVACEAEEERDVVMRSGDGLHLPEVEETRAAYERHSTPTNVETMSGVSEDADPIYEEDFADTSSLDSRDGDVPEGDSSVVSAAEVETSTSTTDARRAATQKRKGRSASKAQPDSSILEDSSVVGTGLSGEVETSVSSVRSSTASSLRHSGIDTASSLSREAGRTRTAAKPRPGQLSHESGEGVLQALQEFYQTCRTANALMKRLEGVESTEAETPSKGNAVAPSGDEGVARTDPPHHGLVLREELADVRRLRRFTDRLRHHLSLLDLEHRAHLAKKRLLTQAQALARAHRALSEDERALLKDVLPAAIADRVLAAHQARYATTTIDTPSHGGRARSGTQKRPATKKGARQHRRTPTSIDEVSSQADGSTNVSAMEASDILFIRSTQTQKPRRRKHRTGDRRSVDEIMEEESIAEEAPALGSSGVESVYSSISDEDGVLEETGSEVVESISDIEEVVDSENGWASHVSSDGSVAEESDEIGYTSASFESLSAPSLASSEHNDNSNRRERKSAPSKDASPVPEEELDELELALERAMEEHSVAHVFRHLQRKGSTSRRRQQDGLQDFTERLDADEAMDTADARLLDRLVRSSGDLSQILSDSSIAENIHERPLEARHGTTDEDPVEEETDEREEHSSIIQESGARTTKRSSKSDVAHNQDSTTVPFTPISPEASSGTHPKETETDLYASRGKSANDSFAASLTTTIGSSETLGEEELRSLEEDLRVTRSRRQRALRRVSNHSPNPREHRHSRQVAVQRNHHVDGCTIETFTQLYDPADTTLSSLDDVSSASSAARRTSHDRRLDHLDEVPSFRTGGETLLRLQILRDAASDERHKRNTRVFVAEPDLLRSAGTDPHARHKIAQPSASPGGSDTATDLRVAEQPTEETSVQREAPEAAPLQAQTVAATDSTDVAHCENSKPHDERASTAPTFPGRPNPLPNLREDFVALAAWKQQQFDLCRQLRRHGTAEDPTQEVFDEEGATCCRQPLLSPLVTEKDSSRNDSSSQRCLHAKAAVPDGEVGSLAYHWGVLESLLETRFGRRTDTAAATEAFSTRPHLADLDSLDEDDGAGDLLTGASSSWDSDDGDAHRRFYYPAMLPSADEDPTASGAALGKPKGKGESRESDFSTSTSAHLADVSSSTTA